LALLGDPRFRGVDAFCLPDEPLLGFEQIPAGPFAMGGDSFDDEKPWCDVDLPLFYIALYPVTYSQYDAFIKDTGHEPPKAMLDDEQPYVWHEDGYPPKRANQPVVLVSWHEAMAYCHWLTGKLRDWKDTPEPLGILLREKRWEITLPSEAEWEKAARGDKDRREYPWGDSFEAARCNCFETNLKDMTPVGIFPEGRSPYEVLDMAGNVLEWTRSQYKEYPYDLNDGREDLEAGDDVPRVLRGGSFIGNRHSVRCAFRGWKSTHSRSGLGFRVVVSPIRSGI
jgi:formylglycine-generating enzyme required for sulfatase activity